MDSYRTGIIRYESRKSTDLTEADIRACSDLFSTSYGMYDMNSPIRPGEQIMDVA